MSPRTAAKILIPTLATLVALAACEIVLRVVWHNPYRHESPDRVLKLRMQHPRADHEYGRGQIATDDTRVRLRTDERSYILPSVRYPTPDATIVFFGGSTTECAGVQEHLRFPALVSDSLATHGLEVNTLNVARSGNNVHDVLNVLLNHVVVDRPDVAVLMEASNDIGLLRAAGSYEPNMGGPASWTLIGRTLAQMASSHSYLAGLVRQSTRPGIGRPKDPSTDWRQTQPPADSTWVAMYRSRLKAFVHVCRDFDIVPVLMTQPYSRYRTPLTPAWLDSTAQDQFNDVIREVGKTEGVGVIDLAEYVPTIPGWDTPNDFFYDAIHVTDKGSVVYAQRIAQELRPLISSSR